MSAETVVTSPAGPMIAPQIRGEGITVVYRDRTVVEVDEITLPAGETYVLLGASGAGKSTLLRVLGMLERPTSGTVYFDNAPVEHRNLEMRRRIAAVFQKPYLLRGDVGDNVGYGLRLRGVPPKERAERVAEALARVGLSGWEKHSALTLSGGEAQRVALARAIILKPQLLLLDEPLSYLDPILKRQLSLEFAEILAGEHVTTLYVTHDQDEAIVVADRMGVMRGGRILADGDPETILALPTDEWVASFLGTESPMEGTVTSSEDGVMRVECGGETSIFATGEIPSGTRVIAGVRPEDVLLFEAGADIPLTSARNRLDATVVEVAPSGATVRVVLAAGCVRLSAIVSRSSAKALDIHAGGPVVALFKATAVKVREVAS